MPPPHKARIPLPQFENFYVPMMPPPHLSPYLEGIPFFCFRDF